jgi:hypothetical protein
MKKNMVYFVLYIILIAELLVVITERDELQAVEFEIRNKMLTTLAENYKSDIYLSIPEKESEYSLGAKENVRVVLTPIGLTSEKEKENIEFFIDIAEDSKNIPPNWPKGGINLSTLNEDYNIEKEEGNGVFIAKFSRIGSYKFVAYCQVQRVLPEYLPENLLEELKREVGENLIKKSNLEDFIINAKSFGGLEKKEAKIIF